MAAVILQEDKEQYLAPSEQVYGQKVHTSVLDEDAMDMDSPTVEPGIMKTNQGFDDSNSMTSGALASSRDKMTG
jgi:hypothetical protein